MSLPSLGRLRRIDLRQVWLSEPGGFTPWLAQEENLRLLGETIGIDLELECQEKAVGPFRADILCKDTATEQWVLIENQLERTDHVHLGQLITYAAGLQAVNIVWIAQRFTEEHRAALDWLNERTDDHINFFGLEIELWQIGDSQIAPKFNVVSQPNEWTRTVHQSVANSGPLSEYRALQLEFWTSYKQYLESSNSPLRCQTPAASHYYNHSIGRSGFYLSSILGSLASTSGTRPTEIRAVLVLAGERARDQFAFLESQKQRIEIEVGFPLIWSWESAQTTQKIYARKDADFTDKSLWPSQFEWFRTHQEALLRAFSPIVREMRDSGI